jgi:hypothetical protein
MPLPRFDCFYFPVKEIKKKGGLKEILPSKLVFTHQQLD